MATCRPTGGSGFPSALLIIRESAIVRVTTKSSRKRVRQTVGHHSDIGSEVDNIRREVNKFLEKIGEDETVVSASGVIDGDSGDIEKFFIKNGEVIVEKVVITAL